MDCYQRRECLAMKLIPYCACRQACPLNHGVMSQRRYDIVHYHGVICIYPIQYPP